jgi:AcrR family transcriptional regulator
MRVTCARLLSISIPYRYTKNVTSARRPVRRAAENRERVLRAAGEVIAERGIELTRYADVARRADVSISTLQYLFGSLDALVVQVVTYQAQGYLASAREHSEAIENPVARLGWVIDHFVTADVGEADARADWLVWVEYWRAAAREPELRRDSHAAYEGWLQIVRDAIDAGVAARAFRPRIDVATAARGILAMSDGFGIQIILEHGGTGRAEASRMVREWAAAVLQCTRLRARGGAVSS